MIIQENGRVRLTKDEFNKLRAHAARNGFALEGPRDVGDLIEAVLLGLSEDRAEDMYAFIVSRESRIDKKGGSSETNDG